jgi:hypothetical protein
VSNRLPISDIKAMLQERLDALVRLLCPGMSVKGGLYSGRCPWRQDRNAGSFVIWRAGRACGAWRDYATDEKGDVLDLIAFAQCGAVGKPSKEDRLAALSWAKEWLGLATTDPGVVAKARARAQQALTAAQEAEDRKRADRRRRAFALWIDGKDWADTPAQAYLAKRGVDAAAIANWADGVRFAPRLDHWLQKGFHGPALICAFRHPAAGFAALHAVWLAPDGRGKAHVDPPKLTLGSSSGCAMRLTKGEGSSPPIAICEGPEDGLSVALACPEYAVWAVGGVNNIGKQRIPQGTPFVVVCADNDWGKAQAAAALDGGVEALKAQGFPVAVARAHAGKDMNDLMRASR